MNDDTKELYVFYHLILVDMERVQKSVEYLSTVEDKHVAEALFRDAVVSYAKPFSGNRRFIAQSRLRLADTFVSAALRAAHDDIIVLRNKLFAHMDLDHQVPNVSVHIVDGRPRISFSVRGYERVFAEHLVAPLAALAKSAHTYCMNECFAIEDAV